MKTALSAADLLNDRVLPLFDEHGMGLIRILTDRGTEFFGKAQHHEYQLYLALNDIEHTKTKARHPQTNGIAERFHKSILNEFYQVTFRKRSIQAWMNYKRTWMSGCSGITLNALIKARCAAVERRCKPS